MSNPKQYRLFKILNNGTSYNITQPININCPFLVKRIKFDFAYHIGATYLTNIAVSSNIVNNEIVGVLNNFSLLENNNYHYVDGFSFDKTFEFVFQDPKTISGDINLTFVDLNSAFNNIISSNIVVMIECLS